MPQPCENSGQTIHSEHDSHSSVGLFSAEQLLTPSFWGRRLQKNGTVEVASEKEGFFLADKNRSKMVEVSACCQLFLKCLHPKLELTVSDNGEGHAVGRR